MGAVPTSGAAPIPSFECPESVTGVINVRFNLRLLSTLIPYLVITACGLKSLLPIASADDDSVFVQAQDGRLVTGLPAAGGTSFALERVFSSQFPSTFAWNNPGFHSLASAPIGLESIPEGTDLAFDFLPMTVDGVVSNLLYWDGDGEGTDDVEFGPPPADGYTMTLFGRNNAPGVVAGTDEMVAGAVLGKTESGPGLRMHEHRFFFLDDGNELSDPIDGVYMVAMQLRMEEFRATEPFYLLWGTLNTPPSAVESVARPWVESQVDELIRDGDFNFDGVVDGADFEVWSRQDGYAGPFPFEGSYADGNRDGVVDEADLAIWQANVACDPTTQGDTDGNGTVDFADFIVLSRNFGQAASTHTEGDIDCSGTVDFNDFITLSSNFGGTTESQAVPEPGGATSILAGCLLLLLLMRRRHV